MSEPLLHHILDTVDLDAAQVAICGELMPRNDIRIGQKVELCQGCLRVRRERKQR